jgi:N6-adenosine-specific RNA methylase IME4
VKKYKIIYADPPWSYRDKAKKRIVELVGNLPRIELFARKKTEGWDSIGYDIDGVDIKESLNKLITKCKDGRNER